MDVWTLFPLLLSIFRFFDDCGAEIGPDQLEKNLAAISPLFIKRFQFHILAKALTEECFYQHGYEESRFVLFYQVMDDEEKIRYREKNPSGEVTFTERKSRGHRTIDSSELEGDYQFCFTSIKRRGQKVHVMLAIVDGKLQKKLYEESTDVPEDYQGLWNATIELISDINDMHGYIFQGRRRARSDRHLVQQNGQFVGYWSMAQCCVIILAGLAQVYALRSMFKTVAVTPTNKPRS